MLIDVFSTNYEQKAAELRDNQARLFHLGALSTASKAQQFWAAAAKRDCKAILRYPDYFSAIDLVSAVKLVPQELAQENSRLSSRHLQDMVSLLLTFPEEHEMILKCLLAKAKRDTEGGAWHISNELVNSINHIALDILSEQNNGHIYKRHIDQVLFTENGSLTSEQTSVRFIKKIASMAEHASGLAVRNLYVGSLYSLDRLDLVAQLLDPNDPATDILDRTLSHDVSTVQRTTVWRACQHRAYLGDNKRQLMISMLQSDCVQELSNIFHLSDQNNLTLLLQISFQEPISENVQKKVWRRCRYSLESDLPKEVNVFVAEETEVAAMLVCHEFVTGLLRLNAVGVLVELFPPERFSCVLLNTVRGDFELADSKYFIYHECQKNNQLDDSGQIDLIHHLYSTHQWDEIVAHYTLQQSTEYLRSGGKTLLPILNELYRQYQVQAVNASPDRQAQVLGNKKILLWRMMNEWVVTLDYEVKVQMGALVNQLSDDIDGHKVVYQMLYHYWRPNQLMPSLLKIALDNTQLDPEKILSIVGGIHIENQVRRNKYAMALIEYSTLGAIGGQKLLPVESTVDCSVCCDEVVSGTPAFKFSNECELTFCLDCGVDSLKNLSPNNTCLGACQCPAHSSMAIDLNTPAEIHHKIQENNVKNILDSIENWRVCDQPNCIGGYRDKKFQKTHQNLTESSSNNGEIQDCMLCSNFKESVKHTQQQMSDLRFIVKKLVVDIGPITGAHANGDTAYRECFHCGTPNEKDAKCASVTCSGCEKSYDFVGGSAPPSNVAGSYFYHRNGVPAQQYIPVKKNSLLWRYGFYEANVHVPGTKNIKAIMDLIHDEKQRLETVLLSIESEKDNLLHSEMLLKKNNTIDHEVIGAVHYSADKTSLELMYEDKIQYLHDGAWAFGIFREKLDPDSGTAEIITSSGEPMVCALKDIYPLGTASDYFEPMIGEEIEFRKRSLMSLLTGPKWYVGRVKAISGNDIVLEEVRDGYEYKISDYSTCIAPLGIHT